MSLNVGAASQNDIYTCASVRLSLACRRTSQMKNQGEWWRQCWEQRHSPVIIWGCRGWRRTGLSTCSVSVPNSPRTYRGGIPSRRLFQSKGQVYRPSAGSKRARQHRGRALPSLQRLLLVLGMLSEPRPRLAPDSSYASGFCFLCVPTARALAIRHGALLS